MPGDGSGMIETGPQTDLAGLAIQGPTGPGWVVEIFGHHFYNDRKAKRDDIGSGHVEKTLLKQLKDGFVDVPLGPGQPPARFSMKELGIGYAILAYSSRPRKHYFPNPNYTPPVNTGVGGVPGVGGLAGTAGAMPIPGAGGIPGAPGTMPIDPNNPEYFETTRYDFAIQFVWQEKPLKVRLEEREKAKEAARQAAEAAAAGSAAAADGAESGTPAPTAGPAPAAPLPPSQPTDSSAPAPPAPLPVDAQPGAAPPAIPPDAATAQPGAAPAPPGAGVQPAIPPSIPDAP
jgi:type IV pilus assembly protein PilM